MLMRKLFDIVFISIFFHPGNYIVSVRNGGNMLSPGLLQPLIKSCLSPDDRSVFDRHLRDQRFIIISHFAVTVCKGHRLFFHPE